MLSANRNVDGKKTSGGVATILSPFAQKAKSAAGSQYFNFCDRIYTVWPNPPDAKKRLVKIFFAVAYFSNEAEKTQLRQDNLLQFEKHISSC